MHDPGKQVRKSGLMGHPPGLAVLFLTEMWERFSYYGMRALLTLYLVKHFLFGEEAAFVLYGTYTALAYLTPAIGGYVADRWLGARRAVVLGGVLLTIGHLLLAIEGDGNNDPFYLDVFYLALSFIVVGVGFLKANISVLVGSLYEQHDIQRDAGFTIFFMGINIGAALGAIIAGYLGERYGWSYGFGAAGVGMVFGLAVFIFGAPVLGDTGQAPAPEALRRHWVGIRLEWRIYLASLGGVAIAWQLMQHRALVGSLLGLAGGLLVAYILFTAATQLGKIERDRMIVAIVLMAFSVLFFALFEQAGSSLNLYTDRAVDRRMFGITVPASIFQSVNAIYIIALAPLLAGFWTFLARRGAEPSTPAKFGLALLNLGAGFLVLVLGSAAGPGLTPVLYIFLLYLLHTLGELCLSPVGLSAMTRLAVPRMAGLVMGTWFFAQAGGNFLAGVIAGATGGGRDDMNAVIDVYQVIGWTGVTVGSVIFLLAPFLKRLMHAGGIAGASDPISVTKLERES